MPSKFVTGSGSGGLPRYVLPYAAGAAYFVDQANCSPAGDGHRGAAKFGYDFLMPIGTPIHSVRAGLVIQVEASHLDGEVAATGSDNVVVVQHSDGTTALYGHLTHGGAAVRIGDHVAQETLVAYSGNTGNTGNKPHLHLSIASCDPVTRGTISCPTLPMNFRNTDSNPRGLERGRSYTAHTP